MGCGREIAKTHSLVKTPSTRRHSQRQVKLGKNPSRNAPQDSAGFLPSQWPRIDGDHPFVHSYATHPAMAKPGFSRLGGDLVQRRETHHRQANSRFDSASGFRDSASVGRACRSRSRLRCRENPRFRETMLALERQRPTLESHTIFYARGARELTAGASPQGRSWRRAAGAELARMGGSRTQLSPARASPFFVRLYTDVCELFARGALRLGDGGSRGSGCALRMSRPWREVWVRLRRRATAARG